MRGEERRREEKRREVDKKRREGVLKRGIGEAPHRKDGASKVWE